MKIIQFNAENVKKLRAVEITPKGELVTIAGRNGQGKTSILDSIWMALDNKRVDASMPIRKGETKARVRLDLGEIVVERRFTEKGSQLIVENAEGARLPSPQAVLDALLGELAFDPLAFANDDPRKQYDILRRISNLTVDIDALDAANKSDFDKRTDINRDAKAKRATAENMPVPADVPATLVDETEILNRMESASQKNSERAMRLARRQATARTIQELKESIPHHERAIAELETRIAAERAAIEAAKVEGKKLQDQLDAAPALPDEVDVTATRAELDRARSANAAIAKHAERQKVMAEAEALESKAQALTDQIDARKKAKVDAIAAAQMPVPGLGFGDGIVTYNGVPFDQASSAEQLRISLEIAMAANPKLRVIRIQHGNDLDEDSLALVAKAAKDRDYQIWIERVDSSGKVGIVIEDGAVIAVDGERPVAKSKAA